MSGAHYDAWSLCTLFNWQTIFWNSSPFNQVKCYPSRINSRASNCHHLRWVSLPCFPIRATHFPFLSFSKHVSNFIYSLSINLVCIMTYIFWMINVWIFFRTNLVHEQSFRHSVKKMLPFDRVFPFPKKLKGQNQEYGKKSF